MKHKIIDGEILTIHRLIVYKFSLPEFDRGNENDILQAWARSESGQFIINHSIDEPSIEKMIHPYMFETCYCIIATLEQSKLSEYYLRFDNKSL